jgi:hypothetical protein
MEEYTNILVSKRANTHRCGWAMEKNIGLQEKTWHKQGKLCPAAEAGCRTPRSKEEEIETGSQNKPRPVHSRDSSWTGELQHLVQLDQSLLTRIPQQKDTLMFLSWVECEARKCFVCSSAPIPMRLHAFYSFHMTTSGIDVQSLVGKSRLTWRFLPVDFVHQSMRRCAYLMQAPNFNECIPLSVSRNSSTLKG